MCVCAWSSRCPGCQCADPDTASLSGGGRGLRSIRPGAGGGGGDPGRLAGAGESWLAGLSVPGLEARELISPYEGG